MSLLIKPVRWTECLNTLKNEGCEKFLEVGPGKVLTGLVKQTCPDISCTPLETPESIEEYMGK